MHKLGKVISALAVIVLILGIIFAWVGHGAAGYELTETEKEYAKHRDYDPEGWGHSDECTVCEEFSKTLTLLDRANTVSAMETWSKCLWYVIGCSLMFCTGKVIAAKFEEEY
ncbi:MAG: hypothetical protein IKW01_03565 [Firmicutes bacterium]|nr:hypothetical protein [Bacillota bacterium]